MVENFECTTIIVGKKYTGFQSLSRIKSFSLKKKRESQVANNLCQKRHGTTTTSMSLTKNKTPNWLGFQNYFDFFPLICNDKIR